MNIFIAEINGKIATLTAEESWHCSRVLRKKSGDEIKLIDGAGAFYDARLDVVSDKKSTASIINGPVFQKPSSHFLHLAIAPTKNIDRIEWMLEKAVEIGIQEISFFIANNSERSSIKQERMQGIIESAVKQSLQARIPKLNPLRSFAQLLKEAEADQKFIAHCFEGPKQEIDKISFAGQKTLVLIGPEGDFTKQECEMARTAGFKDLSLGENRLRTETAGLYVCLAAALIK